MRILKKSKKTVPSSDEWDKWDKWASWGKCIQLINQSKSNQDPTLCFRTPRGLRVAEMAEECNTADRQRSAVPFVSISAIIKEIKMRPRKATNTRLMPSTHWPRTKAGTGTWSSPGWAALSGSIPNWLNPEKADLGFRGGGVPFEGDVNSAMARRNVKMNVGWIMKF